MSQTNHAARLREMAEAEKEHAQSYARLSAHEEKSRNFGSAQFYATVADRRRLDAQALLAGAAALEAVAQMRRFAEAMADDSSPVLHGFAYQIQTVLDKHDMEKPNEKD